MTEREREKGLKFRLVQQYLNFYSPEQVKDSSKYSGQGFL